MPGDLSRHAQAARPCTESFVYTCEEAYSDGAHFLLSSDSKNRAASEMLSRKIESLVVVSVTC